MPQKDFSRCSLEELAMRYALNEWPNAPELYYTYAIHKEICKRVGIYAAADHISNARNILKMVNVNAS